MFYRRQIQFRPLKNLEQVVLSLDVYPHHLDALCAVTSSPSQLFYCDHNTHTIHQVDCSTTPPTLLGKKSSVDYDGLRAVFHMCTSGDFLVTSRCDEGVFGYPLRGVGELNWTVSGKPPGMDWEMVASEVAADEQGHLFVSDYSNSCLHLLSVRDGEYLGVLKSDELDVGKPKEVAWHSESASLVVAHAEDRVLYLSVLYRL